MIKIYGNKFIGNKTFCKILFMTFSCIRDNFARILIKKPKLLKINFFRKFTLRKKNSNFVLIIQLFIN